MGKDDKRLHLWQSWIASILRGSVGGLRCGLRFHHVYEHTATSCRWLRIFFLILVLQNYAV